jgi:hypothetical protein
VTYQHARPAGFEDLDTPRLAGASRSRLPRAGARFDRRRVSKRSPPPWPRERRSGDARIRLEECLTGAEAAVSALPGRARRYRQFLLSRLKQHAIKWPPSDCRRRFVIGSVPHTNLLVGNRHVRLRVSVWPILDGAPYELLEMAGALV